MIPSARHFQRDTDRQFKRERQCDCNLVSGRGRSGGRAHTSVCRPSAGAVYYGLSSAHANTRPAFSGVRVCCDLSTRRRRENKACHSGGGSAAVADLKRCERRVRCWVFDQMRAFNVLNICVSFYIARFDVDTSLCIVKIKSEPSRRFASGCDI